MSIITPTEPAPLKVAVLRGFLNATDAPILSDLLNEIQTAADERSLAFHRYLLIPEGLSSPLEASVYYVVGDIPEEATSFADLDEAHAFLSEHANVRFPAIYDETSDDPRVLQNLGWLLTQATCSDDCSDQEPDVDDEQEF